jgi:protein-tyrosine phosphatase
MIDFHNHILPKIDDGSKSIEMTLSMLESALHQGITDIVNTVHYQHPKVEGNDISYERINFERDKLQSLLYDRKIPIKIHISSEVFYLPNLMKIIDDPITTTGNGKYILVEFLPTNIPESHKQQFFDLKMEGITPIIAHPERYLQVQDNINLVGDWLEAGCLVQVDAGSPLGLLGHKAKIASEKILYNNWAQIIGSDAHDDKNRNFCLKRSIDYICKKFGEDKYVMVKENPGKILRGEPIIVDVNYPDNLDNFSFADSLKEMVGWEKKK